METQLQIKQQLTNKSDFSLNFKNKSVFMSKRNFKITPYIDINFIEVEMLDVGFPYDLSKGSNQLKNNRANLINLEFYIYSNELENYFIERLDKSKFLNIKIIFKNQKAIISGMYLQKDVKIPFIFHFGVYLHNSKIIILLIDDFVGGILSIFKYDLILEMLQPFNLNNLNPFEFTIDIFPDIFLSIFAKYGYKIPSYKNAAFEIVNFENDIGHLKISNEFHIKKDITISNETIKKIEEYKQNLDILTDYYKSKNIKYIKSEIEKNNYFTNVLFAKFYVEVIENDFSTTEILKYLLNKNNNPSLLLSIAQKYYDLNEIEQYEAIMSILINICLKSKDFILLELLYINLAFNYKNKENKKSIIYFEKLWNLNKNLIFLWFDFFLELIKYNEYFLALEVGQYILNSLDVEKKAILLEHLGDIALNNLNKVDESLNYYSYALRLFPNSVILKLKIIDVYIKKENYKFATLKLNDLLENNDSFYLKNKIHERLFNIWDKQNEYERAIYHLEQIIKDKFDMNYYYKGYELTFKLKDFERAKHYLKTIINHYEHYELLYDDLFFKAIKNIADIYLTEENFNKSIEYYNKIPLSFFNKNEINSIIKLLFSVNKFDDIEKYYLKLIEIEKNDEEKANVYKELALIMKNTFNNTEKFLIYCFNSIINNVNQQNLIEIFYKYNQKVSDYNLVAIVYSKFAEAESDKIKKSELYFQVFKIKYLNKEKVNSFEYLKLSLKFNPQNAEAVKIFNEITKLKKT